MNCILNGENYLIVFIMKKLKMLVVALTMTVGLIAPAKKAVSQDIGGRWIVTIYSAEHWNCTQGGGVCCPGWDC